MGKNKYLLSVKKSLKSKATLPKPLLQDDGALNGPSIRLGGAASDFPKES